MASSRLKVQFERLFEHFRGEDSDVQLDEITDTLCCTRRNVRIVLNKMVEEGWIEWHPSPGRGKLSKLNFVRSRQDVSENLAKKYLDQGKVNQALSVLDNDGAKLAQVLQQYLGVQHQSGQQVIRLPYYRPLSMLNPLKPMRRSELHIARQVFSGLTRLDENEHLQADLAHTWESISSTHWRFYIRPGVRFHNGEPLTTDIIIDSLSNLSSRDLFTHIEKVDSPSNWVIDVYLRKPDVNLALMLTESCAKILLPAPRRSELFDLTPVGTGPYQITQNDTKRLVLQANDTYFGLRPLLDRVEVWVIDEVYSSIVFPSLSQPFVPESAIATVTESVELDPGCTYLLVNRKTGLGNSDVWARYFAGKLNSLDLYRLLPQSTINELGVLPAHGLKPGWYHHVEADINLSPPDMQTVTIAYFSQHPTFPKLAKCIEQTLQSDGLFVELIEYDNQEPDSDSVDIWIKPMGITSNRDEALAGWLLDYSDIAKLSRDADFSAWKTLIEEWRAGSRSVFPGKELGRALVEAHQVIPMFHCWLGVSKDHCGSLQNAQCNALGWFDFSQVWVKPDIEQPEA